MNNQVNGVYFAKQTFFNTGKLLTNKFDLIYEESVSKSQLAQSMPSTLMQQTLMSVTEGFKSFKELRSLFLKGQLHFQPKLPDYLKAYPNSGGQSKNRAWLIVNLDFPWG